MKQLTVKLTKEEKDNLTNYTAALSVNGVDLRAISDSHLFWILKQIEKATEEL
jgi:hypothetical protein